MKIFNYMIASKLKLKFLDVRRSLINSTRTYQPVQITRYYHRQDIFSKHLNRYPLR